MAAVTYVRRTLYLLLVLLLLSVSPMDEILLYSHVLTFRFLGPRINATLPHQPSFKADFVQSIERNLLHKSRALKLQCSSCAIVFSSGLLINSSAGQEIDGHECVVRFNDAPVGGKYSRDVGTRTTIRFVGREAIEEILTRKRLTGGYSDVIKDEMVVMYTLSNASALMKSFPRNKYLVSFKHWHDVIMRTEVDKVVHANPSLSGLPDAKQLKPSSGQKF